MCDTISIFDEGLNYNGAWERNQAKVMIPNNQETVMCTPPTFLLLLASNDAGLSSA